MSNDLHIPDAMFKIQQIINEVYLSGCDVYRKQYLELLDVVGENHSGETRHAAALRYIKIGQNCAIIELDDNDKPIRSDGGRQTERKVLRSQPESNIENHTPVKISGENKAFTYRMWCHHCQNNTHNTCDCYQHLQLLLMK